MAERNQPININLSQRSRKVDSEEKLKRYILTQLGDPLITVDVTDEQIYQSIDDAFSIFVEWVYNSEQHQVFVMEAQHGIQDYILDERIKAIYGMSIADTTSGYGGGSGNGMMQGESLIPGGSIVPPNYIPYVNMEGQQSSLENSGGGNAGPATGVAGGVTGPNTNKGDSGSDAMNQAWAAMTNMQSMQYMFGSSISYDFNAMNHTLRIFEDVSGPICIEAAMSYIPNPEYDGAYGHPFIKAMALNLTKRTWGTNLGKYTSSLVGGAELNYDRIITEAQLELDRLNEELLERWSEPLGIFSA